MERADYVRLYVNSCKTAERTISGKREAELKIAAADALKAASLFAPGTVLEFRNGRFKEREAL
jgi:hypothetical protein